MIETPDTALKRKERQIIESAERFERAETMKDKATIGDKEDFFDSSKISRPRTLPLQQMQLAQTD